MSKESYLKYIDHSDLGRFLAEATTPQERLRGWSNPLDAGAVAKKT
jgi:hypothetical protein